MSDTNLDEHKQEIIEHKQEPEIIEKKQVLFELE